MMNFSGKRIILGVTGGIAAYKAAFLLREFQKAGAEIRVTMTPSATRFVGIETFASLSGHDVAINIFPDEGSSDAWTRHIEWGEWADLFVIAPCTANTLAKVVYGLADSMLTSTVLAARCPILICPTMDGEMYEAPSVQANLKKATDYGYHILEPETGYLASGQEGKGRLPEFDTILSKAHQITGQKKSQLSGKKVLVTAGPTREFIDPVRFISNPSSGKMGYAMARAAQQLGADVTLIHGPLSIQINGIASKAITTAKELFDAVKAQSDADVIIMAAAVSDFTPVETHQHKVKKGTGGNSSIELTQTTDILKWLGEHKKEGQVLIGFAMETQNLIDNATQKLESKNADWIIANSLASENSGFEIDTNHVFLLGKNERKELKGPKTELAQKILGYIFS